MKVCVYAISKNEEKFVARWVESMKEADEIYVLDTGSTDATVDLFRENGVNVTVEKIDPWRFDVARNKSLELVPQDADICVCTDIDEVMEPGWREKLERAWTPGTKQARYRYTWNFNPDGSEGYVFWIEKIHTRHDFQWEHPVHEILKYTGDEPYKSVYVDGMQLNHLADVTKSRAQYLELLELSVEECPEDDRNMHYLGREYMYKGRWNDCINTLKRHLQLKSATWPEERCASMRYIAKSYQMLDDNDSAEAWYLRACAESPKLREPWVDYAEFLYGRGNWYGIIFACQKALLVKERQKTYIAEAKSWGSLPYDLLSLGHYYTGDLKRAVYYAGCALNASPKDERIKRNYAIMERELKESIGGR